MTTTPDAAATAGGEEHETSRWLSGRGTRVLYAAIGLTIIGTLLTGQSMSQARAESERAAASVENAVRLASEVSKLCEKPEFHLVHTDACARAAEILGDPSKAAGGLMVDAAVDVAR